ncbi:MAG: protease modulator HflC [Rhizobiaceae bacterium]|nr:MAG: protease modulator HflC [Rhizobiaceae bacterium]CAG0982822.1 Modulator of FtsH protease HflC [Rhizobiaceae bacterium]
MKPVRIAALGVLGLGFLGATLTLYQVDTTEYAIVTQFGRPVRVLSDPGLYIKAPDPIQSVLKISKQIQVYNLPKTEFLSSDKKNIMVEAYATWQVTDALAFLKNVNSLRGASTQLNDIIKAELGAALGQVELGNLVTVETSQASLPDTLNAVKERAAARTGAYGFTVTDIQLKELTFPEANLTSVFQRMRSEREAIARQFRSEGAEEAARIRAEADTEKAKILATASRESAEIRGTADAEAIAIYASSFGRDKDFYRFSRTLEAYDKFIDEGTTLILPADSELLQYLDPRNALKLPPSSTSTGGSAVGSRNVTADSERDR